MLICKIWGLTDVLWKDANWKWSECSSSIVSVIGNDPGVDASKLVQPWIEEPWNPYKTGSLESRNKLIKLICKIDGKEYDEEKKVKDFKLTVDDIRMVIKNKDDINVNLKLEE